MTAEDLASIFRRVGGADFHRNTADGSVYELPPNGQGIAALEMLNIMETLPAGKNGPYAGWTNCTGGSNP